MQYQTFLQDITSVLTVQALEGKRDRDTERHRYTERKAKNRDRLTQTETGRHR